MRGAAWGSPRQVAGVEGDDGLDDVARGVGILLAHGVQQPVVQLECFGFVLAPREGAGEVLAEVAGDDAVDLAEDGVARRGGDAGVKGHVGLDAVALPLLAARERGVHQPEILVAAAAGREGDDGFFNGESRFEDAAQIGLLQAVREGGVEAIRRGDVGAVPRPREEHARVDEALNGLAQGVVADAEVPDELGLRRDALPDLPLPAADELLHVLADAVGVNCSLGPKQLLPAVKAILENTQKPVIVQANAGLPDENSDYSVSADEFAQVYKEMLGMGVRIIGGCCGTTPGYIKKLRALADGAKPAPSPYKRRSAVCSATKTVEIDGVRVIGERINPTGKKAMKAALYEGNYGYVTQQALEQADAGADILDVNAGLPGADDVLPCVQ